jgi:hypothetical protein
MHERDKGKNEMGRGMTVEWTNETNTGDKSMKGIKEMKEEGDK